MRHGSSPKGLAATEEAKKEACSDNRSDVGDQLQAAVDGFNSTWKGLPADSREKYTQDQYDRISGWMEELNAIRTR